MDFAFSEEQELMRAAARDYLADRFPIDRVVELIDSAEGWDPQSWKELTEMGWLDDDLGFLEHAILAEETGRTLYPGPLFTTLALARPAGYVGSEPATLAVATSNLVPDLAISSYVGVATNGDVTFSPTSELTSTPRSTMDRSRRYAELSGGGGTALPRVRRRALAWLACEAVGVAQRALDTATEHAKERKAFDRPIGTFQAVSHQIADVFTQVELARSLAYWAAWAVDADDERVDLACAAAKSAASEAAVFACERAIQVLGGIGFTWEHFLHRYYKRAQWIDSYEGYGATHRAVIAAALLG